VSCSQDVWIFNNKINKSINADFSLGVLGCDNRLSFLLNESGYNVTNPSKTIRCIHRHNSNIRNYTRDYYDPNYCRVSEPYLFIDSTYLK